MPYRAQGLVNVVDQIVPQGHEHRVKALGKSHGPPQSTAETSKKPPQRPLRIPVRGKFPRRASQRVVPLGL